MPEPYEISIGKWWRFTEYELRGGYIRPTSQAKLKSYDPWKEFYGTRSTGKQPVFPYETLIELLKKVRPVFGKDGSLSVAPEDETFLLQWCCQHGLLGILPQQTLMVNLAPTWEYPLLGPRGPLFPSQHYYIRTNTGWKASYHQVTRRQLIQSDPHQKGKVVPEKYRLSPLQRPGVLIQEIRTNKLKSSSFEEAWVQFFPDVPRNEAEFYHYPLPLSDGFWRLYAEPIGTFLNMATVLKDAVTDLSCARPLAEASEKELVYLRSGRDSLHALLGPASPALLPKQDGGFDHRWASTSLLASLAMMVFQDLTEQRRILACNTCKKIFVTEAWQRLYCSDRCRRTAQKRRYREKKKDSEKGLEGGMKSSKKTRSRHGRGRVQIK